MLRKLGPRVRKMMESSGLPLSWLETSGEDVLPDVRVLLCTLDN